MKILHTADLHLGQILYQYYDRVDEHDHFFNQLCKWCGDYQPDALLVCGDVFDIPQPSAATKEYFNNTFVKLHRLFPDMAIVVTAGNHDSPSRLEADSPVWGLSGVTLVGHGPASDALQRTDDWQDRFIVELASGFIIAVPFMTSSRPEVLQALLDRVEQRNTDGKPVVMTGHLAVTGGDFSDHGDIGTIRTVEPQQLGTGYDYLALGHIHRPQTIGISQSDESLPSSTYPSGIIRYSGSPLHVSCDEQFPHTVSLVDIASHGGNVTIQRLRVDELRHFYIIPEPSKKPATSIEELNLLINVFCQSHDRGYIRLRIDYGTPLPPDYIQTIYRLLEATCNEVRLNPKTIWENNTEQPKEIDTQKFQIAELQQMTDPLDFIRGTIEMYPELKIDELVSDFQEVEKELRRIQELNK